eukprot:1019529-Pelagomonas_calceolata.AAC.1
MAVEVAPCHRGGGITSGTMPQRWWYHQWHHATKVVVSPVAPCHNGVVVLPWSNAKWSHHWTAQQ